MTFDWQDIAALMIVAAALAYLVRQVLRTARAGSPTRCSGCASCPPSRPAPPLVTIASPSPKR